LYGFLVFHYYFIEFKDWLCSRSVIIFWYWSGSNIKGITGQTMDLSVLKLQALKKAFDKLLPKALRKT